MIEARTKLKDKRVRGLKMEFPSKLGIHQRLVLYSWVLQSANHRSAPMTKANFLMSLLQYASRIGITASIFAITLVFVPFANAELIITVGNAVIAPGGTGTIDVNIRSTAKNSDVLDISSVEFLISTLGGTQLAFENPAVDAHLADPGYLYDGDSANQLLGPPAGLVATSLTNDDTYFGGDGTLSGLGIVVPTTDTLLVRLALTTLTAAPPQDGDVFIVTLVLGANTFFLSPTFDDLALNQNASSLTGAITISSGSTATVPEPGTLTLFSIVTVAGLWFRQRTSRCRQ